MRIPEGPKLTQEEVNELVEKLLKEKKEKSDDGNQDTENRRQKSNRSRTRKRETEMREMTEERRRSKRDAESAPGGRGHLQWAVFLVFALYPLQGHAGLEDRPLNTDDAYTIEKGTWSVSVGSVFLRHDNHDKQTGIVTDVSMSPFPRLEVGLEIPYTFLKPKGRRHESSFGDLVVRPEYQLLSERKFLPAFSSWIAVKTQTGDEDEGIGSGATDVSFAWNLSKKFPGPTWFHVNLGLTLSGESEGEARDNVFFYKFASEVAPWKPVKFVAEIVGDTNANPRQSDVPLEWLLGLIYEPRKRWLFDIGFGTGFTNASPDFRITAGVTCVF